MTITDPHAYRPSLGDRICIVVFMVAGAAIIVWSAIAAGTRILDVARGARIDASVDFIGIKVEAPIGPGGSGVPLDLDTATVTSDSLTPVAAATAVISAAFAFAVITTVVACLMLLARNCLRGRIFGRGNTRLVVAAGTTALVGFGLIPVLERMVANDILAGLVAADFHGYAVLAAEPLPFVLLAFAFGIVATAYTIGARIQRETEGLV